MAYLGTSLDAAAPSLKVLYLLPFVWFLFESKKKTALEENLLTHLKTT
jgi:hypothetical protein